MRRHIFSLVIGLVFAATSSLALSETFKPQPKQLPQPQVKVKLPNPATPAAKPQVKVKPPVLVTPVTPALPVSGCSNVAPPTRPSKLRIRIGLKPVGFDKIAICELSSGFNYNNVGVPIVDTSYNRGVTTVTNLQDYQFIKGEFVNYDPKSLSSDCNPRDATLKYQIQGGGTSPNSFPNSPLKTKVVHQDGNSCIFPFEISQSELNDIFPQGSGSTSVRLQGEICSGAGDVIWDQKFLLEITPQDDVSRGWANLQEANGHSLQGSIATICQDPETRGAIYWSPFVE